MDSRLEGRNIMAEGCVDRSSLVHGCGGGEAGKRRGQELDIDPKVTPP